MSGSTILGAQMAIHQIQQEIEMLKNKPGYAEACNKIHPIIKKYRSLDNRIKNYAMGGGLLAGAIVGAAIGYSLGHYMPQIDKSEIGKYSMNCYVLACEYPMSFFGMWGAVIGEIAGTFISLFKGSKLERKAKKEIDDLGLEYTVDRVCF